MSLTAGDVATITYFLTVDDPDTGLPVPTDADVVLTVTAPDGTVTTYNAPQHPGTGRFRQDVLVEPSGDWGYVWTASGDATDVEAGTFVVEPVSGWSDERTIRLLISDLSIPQTFGDAELRQFLTLEGAVKLAAATALDTLASNEAMVSKKLKTLDLQTDGPAVASSLRAHAALLREQHYYALDGDSTEFEVTTLLGTPQWRRPGAPELTELL